MALTCSYEGCGRKFGQQKRLTTHFRTHTGERPYVCRELVEGDFCAASYTRASHLQRHIDSIHRQIRIQCPDCPSEFRSYQAQKKHISLHHSSVSVDIRFKCDLCGREFKKKSVLRRHISVVHENVDPYPCSACPRHEESGDFQVRFKYPSQLRRHQQQVHGSESGDAHYTCTICKKVFSSVSERLRHRRKEHRRAVSSSDVSHTCKLCTNGHIFVRHANLLAHMREVHSDSAPIYRCDADPACSNVYYSRRNLRWHIKKKHGQQATVERMVSSVEQIHVASHDDSLKTLSARCKSLPFMLSNRSG